MKKEIDPLDKIRDKIKAITEIPKGAKWVTELSYSERGMGLNLLEYKEHMLVQHSEKYWANYTSIPLEVLRKSLGDYIRSGQPNKRFYTFTEYK